jgi:hypothetical protein
MSPNAIPIAFLSGWGDMRTATLGRSVTSWTGALLALLVWALITPLPAGAGCSHYVRSGAFAAGAAIGLEQLATAGAIAADTMPEAPSVPEQPAPCTGATCSRQPAPALPSSSAQPTPHRVGSWALVTVPTRVDKPEPTTAAHLPGNLRPIHSGCSVFHPPRISRPS